MAHVLAELPPISWFEVHSENYFTDGGPALAGLGLVGAYVTPALLGGGRNMMISNLISLQFGQGRNWPLGAALSITLMAIVMAALLVYVRNASRASSRSH